jgi:citrate lyase subunit beta / citryl-CoA lyase
MRRSLLFIPANAPAMLQNADVFSADSVIFDLEDAVLLSEKDAANHLLKEFLTRFSHLSIEKIVRVNAVDTPFFEKDILMIASDFIDTIMLPKATLSSVKQLDSLLSRIEKTKKIKKIIKIVPIIELARSIIEVDEIAKHHRVNGLLLGAEDLATDLEVERTLIGNEIFYARSKVIIAAKANKIDAIDTPFTHVSDENGLINDASFAKSLGMNAKACIHPLQIDHINTIFSPTGKEILHAKKIIEAEKIAKNDQKGAFSVDGKMIDKPIIDRAHQLLEKAKQWGLL